jgi:hypothetical protein
MSEIRSVLRLDVESPYDMRARLAALAARQQRHGANTRWAYDQLADNGLFPKAAAAAWRAINEQQNAQRECKAELDELRRWLRSPMYRTVPQEEREANRLRAEQLGYDYNWFVDSSDADRTGRAWVDALVAMDWLEVRERVLASPQRDAKAPNGESLAEWVEFTVGEKGLRPGDYVR